MTKSKCLDNTRPTKTSNTHSQLILLKHTRTLIKIACNSSVDELSNLSDSTFTLLICSLKTVKEMDEWTRRLAIFLNIQEKSSIEINKCRLFT